MKHLFTILFSLPLFCFAGSKYTLSATSGAVVIAQTTDGHFLIAGDTVLLHVGSTYSSITAQSVAGNGAAHIVVMGNGAYISSSGSLNQVEWQNSSYVDFLNINWYNWYGTNLMEYGLHDITWNGGSAIWDGSGNRNNGQPFMTWDYLFSPVSMVFDGTKAKTFYNINFKNMVWGGITDAYFMSLGTGWGGSDDNRSICTDFVFDNVIISDFRNTAVAGNIHGNQVGAVFGTCFNIKVSNCTIDRMAGKSAYERAHIGTFTIYGNGNFYNNRQDSSYAQMLRVTPMYWTGLPGYADYGIYVWNNIDHNAYSYSSFEVNFNNIGDRNNSFLIYHANDTIVHNTVYSTNAATYDPSNVNPAVVRYHGTIVDDANQTPKINYIAYNAIGNPEKDYSYVPASNNNYIYSIISSANASLTITGNQNYQTFTSVWADTLATFAPASGSALIDAGATFSFRTADIYGHSFSGTPDAGAVEYTAGSVPSCTTNILPANATTITSADFANLSWNSAATATGYDVFLWVNGGSAPGSPTYTTSGTTKKATGLTAGLTYKYYIRPYNGSGSATGCATAFTTFSTHAYLLWILNR